MRALGVTPFVAAIALLALHGSALEAQRLPGRIVDLASGESLPFAVITIEQQGAQVGLALADSVGLRDSGAGQVPEAVLPAKSASGRCGSGDAR